MQLGEGVEWALHCCTVLALVPEGQTLPAARLAEYHGVPPAYLAKHLQSLAQAGLVESTAGRKGGYRLARPAAQVTLLDIVLAVEGGARAFKCSEIRKRGPARAPAAHYRAPCAIARIMHEAEDAWRRELAAVTVGDLLSELAVTASPVAIRKTSNWFQEVMR
jgi:Rrf2 family protein